MKTMELPISFLNTMQELLKEEYPAYLDSFGQERIHSLRVNTTKLEPEQLAKQLFASLSPIPWIPNGFYYDEKHRLSKDPYYYAGLYYLQEPSAMTPAHLLSVQPGDMVLDLCAAPGGKSTELGARLKGKGLLVANDISSSRAKALLKNLELFGIPNICVTSETPEKLCSAFPGYFDKILVDAPCSGEGMFRKDPDMVKSWMEKGPEYYRPIQEAIIKQGVLMLKPGGYLLYSTCTFSRIEDEDVIKHLLKESPDMELVPLPVFDGASDGIGLSGCIRLFPHKLKGEGHFLALLRKRGGETELTWRPEYKTSGSGLLDKEPELKKFLNLIHKKPDENRILIKHDCVYYLPEQFQVKPGLRYLRTGLLLGQLKNGRFEPSQALAMVLKPELFASHISFSREDDRVIRYLKGETLSLREGEAPVTGWCLICVDGFPLGFAKGTGSMLKNKYYPGWRWQ